MSLQLSGPIYCLPTVFLPTYGLNDTKLHQLRGRKKRLSPTGAPRLENVLGVDFVVQNELLMHFLALLPLSWCNFEPP